MTLLSICMSGRDDDYTPDFMYRLTTTINYLGRSIKQLGRLEDIEIVVTDWGSEIPLANSVNASAEAAKICRFLYVPQAVIGAIQNGRQDFHISMASNAAIRRAAGEYVMQSASDTLIPRHALDTILQVLDESLPLPNCLKQTLFLCPRYHIPWQFLERRPGLEEWDRYLLLNASELNYTTDSQLSVYSGTGGFLMHRRLWEQSRGFEEKHGGWGFHDTNLGLRMSQAHSWLGLSCLGVNFYHMEHKPVGRRAVAVKTGAPSDHSRTVEVNDDSWGLGSYELSEQRAAAVRAPEMVESLQGSNDKSFETPRTLIGEIVGELTGGAVVQLVRRTVARCSQDVFLFSKHFLRNNEIEALHFLAWYSLSRYPRSYVEFGIRRGYAAMVVAAADPATELYGIDEWEGISPSGDIIQVAIKLRANVGHRAYVRLINGPIESGVSRLRQSFVGEFTPDLVFVRGDRLGENLSAQIAELLESLAPGGSIVISSTKTGALEALWKKIGKETRGCLFFLSSTRNAGMILADATLANADAEPVICEFTIRPFLQSKETIMKALSQPSRYREFAGRLLMKVAHRN